MRALELAGGPATQQGISQRGNGCKTGARRTFRTPCCLQVLPRRQDKSRYNCSKSAMRRTRAVSDEKASSILGRQNSATLPAPETGIEAGAATPLVARLREECSVTDTERSQLELRKALGQIASPYLEKLARCKNRRDQICKMAGALFDVIAARRFDLVKTEVDAARFAEESKTYLWRIIMSWFDGVPLGDSDREAIQIEVTNHRNQWTTKAYSALYDPASDGSVDPIIRKLMDERGDEIVELASRGTLSLILSSKQDHGKPPLVNAMGEGRGPGRKPNAGMNRRIAQVIASFEPDWRDQLSELCEALDGQELPLPASKKWKTQGCNTWTDVLDTDRQGLVKALEHRSQWVAEHPAK